MTSRQRKLWSAVLYLIPGASKRTEFMRKHRLYGSIGCTEASAKLFHSETKAAAAFQFGVPA